MVLPLANSVAGAVRCIRTVEIRAWTEGDYQPSAAVITASYRGHVDSQINDQYHTLSGSLRFLNNIVRFPGCGTFDPDSSFVAIDRGRETLIGLILCSRVRTTSATSPGLRVARYRSRADRRISAGYHRGGSAQRRQSSRLSR